MLLCRCVYPSPYLVCALSTVAIYQRFERERTEAEEALFKQGECMHAELLYLPVSHWGGHRREQGSITST